MSHLSRARSGHRGGPPAGGIATRWLLGFAMVLLAGLIGVLVWGSGDPAPPTTTWTPEEEVAVPEAGSARASVPATAGERVVSRAVPETGEPPAPATRVASTLRGRVVDPAGRPVAGAGVHLAFRAGRGPAQRRRVPEPVVTGGDGTFAFAGELYRHLFITLEIEHDLYAPMVARRNLGEVEGVVDLGDFALAHGGVLLGSVTDGEGIGIGAATVHLEPIGGNPIARSRRRAELLPPAAADANGFFRFVRVPPGRYRVRGQAPGYQRAFTRPFDVGDGEELRLEPLVLPTGHRLAGRVFDPGGAPVAGARIQAWNLDGRGQRTFRARTDEQGTFAIGHMPPQRFGLRVRAQGYREHREEPVEPAAGRAMLITLHPGLVLRGVVVDAAGGAPIERYAARPRLLRPLEDSASRERLRELQRDRARLDGMFRELRQSLRRESGEARQDMRRRMSSLQARARRLERMLDRVQAERQVTRRSTGRGRPFHQRLPRDPGEAAEHPGGRFVFEGLDEGVYAIDVEAPDHARIRSDEIVLRGDGGPVEVTVPLPRGSRVAGVVRGEGGDAIAGAEVELRQFLAEPGERPLDGRRTGVLHQVESGAGGRFAFGNTPPGRYRLRVRADGFATTMGEPFVLEGDRTGLVLELPPLAALSGEVRNVPAGRQGDVHVTAALLHPDGAIRRGGFPTVGIDAEGRYDIPDLEPGRYLLRAYLGDGRRFLAQKLRTLKERQESPVPDVVLEAGERVVRDLDLRIPDVGTLTGSVTDGGEPARGLLVTMTREGLRTIRHGGTVDPAGRYRIEGLPPGTYELKVHAGRRRSVVHREEVHVPGRRETRHDLVLETGSIAGEVRIEGVPAAEVRGSVLAVADVDEIPEELDTLRQKAPERFRSTRVRNGRFHTEPMPTGPWLLLLRLPGRDDILETVHVNGPDTPLLLRE